MGMLDGKVAIVTGGGSGLGRGEAVILADHGGKVIGNDLGGSVSGEGSDKLHTPRSTEFAFGAVCTNQVCGPTANPWNTELTSGGSSGGSAVAVAAGLVPLAQGTDFGGSVRTPASFCGCVGLRPTPGTIPEPGRALAFDTLASQGVLARSVGDAALMAHVMAGGHPLDPTSRRPGA